MRNQPLVTDEDIEASLHFLLDGAETLGAAEAEAEFAYEMAKVTKAEIISLSTKSSQDRREAEALTHPKFIAALERRREAHRTVRVLLAQRRGHEMRIEVWRTLSANNRGARP